MQVNPKVRSDLADDCVGSLSQFLWLFTQNHVDVRVSGFISGINGVEAWSLGHSIPIDREHCRKWSDLLFLWILQTTAGCERYNYGMFIITRCGSYDHFSNGSLCNGIGSMHFRVANPCRTAQVSSSSTFSIPLSMKTRSNNQPPAHRQVKNRQQSVWSEMFFEKKEFVVYSED